MVALGPCLRRSRRGVLRGFIASTVGLADDEGLHPVPIRPEAPLATLDFRNFSLLSIWSANRLHS